MDCDMDSLTFVRNSCADSGFEPAAMALSIHRPLDGKSPTVDEVPNESV